MVRKSPASVEARTQEEGLVTPETAIMLSLVTLKFYGLSRAILSCPGFVWGRGVEVVFTFVGILERTLHTPKPIIRPKDIPIIPAQTSSFLIKPQI